MPIWVADYVLMGYGHGAIMAVPAHDERDHEFALAFGLPIVQVVEPEDGGKPEGCFSEPGRNVNSKNATVSLDGLRTAEAKARISEWLEQRGIGRRHVNYKLRDWLFSRQRYWGEPFPIVFDADGNHHAIREDALPVEAARARRLQARGERRPEAAARQGAALGARPPRARPACATCRRARRSRARRTRCRTGPARAGTTCASAIRRTPSALLGKEAERYWMGENGVDLYVGGGEHAVLHLLYARFWHQALHDLGYVRSPEPFQKLFHQGMITSYAYERGDKSLVPIDQVEAVAEDQFIEIATRQPVTQITAKMSKSLKNVINPDDVIAEYGADTFRLYEMYMGPLEASKPWNTRDISGLYRFLQRAFRLLVDEGSGELKLRGEADAETEKLLHRTTAKVQEDIERLAFNTAIAALIKLVNEAGAAAA